MFLAPPFTAFPPVVTLSYIDSGLHLAAYQSLFRQLQAFRFLNISPTNAQFVRATERFHSLVKQALESDMSREVLRYFQVRQRFEKRQYVVPVTEDFEFLNEAKRRFHVDRFERHYKAWISGTLSEQGLRHESCQTDFIEPCLSRLTW